MVRVKTRYLTCRLWTPGRGGDNGPGSNGGPGGGGSAPSKTAILKAIRESVQTNFGDFGASALLASLQVRYYDEGRTRIFVLRCRRESYRQAWAAMTLVTAVGGQRPCSIGVLRVSGSVRLCRDDAFRILLATAGLEGTPESTEAREYRRQLEAAVTGV